MHKFNFRKQEKPYKYVQIAWKKNGKENPIISEDDENIYLEIPTGVALMWANQILILRTNPSDFDWGNRNEYENFSKAVEDIFRQKFKFENNKTPL